MQYGSLISNTNHMTLLQRLFLPVEFNITKKCEGPTVVLGCGYRALPESVGSTIFLNTHLQSKTNYMHYHFTWIKKRAQGTK
jgi:hypothetical protein